MATRHGRVDDRRTADNHSRDALHELALIEYKLRHSTTYADHVDVGRNGARITFETGRHNEHFRGSITASLATAVAETACWKLSTVHDPLEKPEQATAQSMFTLVRAEQAREVSR